MDIRASKGALYPKCDIYSSKHPHFRASVISPQLCRHVAGRDVPVARPVSNGPGVYRSRFSSERIVIAPRAPAFRCLIFTPAPGPCEPASPSDCNPASPHSKSKVSSSSDAINPGETHMPPRSHARRHPTLSRRSHDASPRPHTANQMQPSAAHAPHTHDTPEPPRGPRLVEPWMAGEVRHVTHVDSPQTGEAKPPDDAGNGPNTEALPELLGELDLEAPVGLLSARARAKRAFGASFSSVWCSSARASSVAPTAPLGEAVVVAPRIKVLAAGPPLL